MDKQGWLSTETIIGAGASNIKDAVETAGISGFGNG